MNASDANSGGGTGDAQWDLPLIVQKLRQLEDLQRRTDSRKNQLLSLLVAVLGVYFVVTVLYFVQQMGSVIHTKTIYAQEPIISRSDSLSYCRIGYHPRDDVPVMSFHNRDKNLLTLGINWDGGTKMTFFDRNGKARLNAGVSLRPEGGGPHPTHGINDETGIIGIFGSTGKLGLELGLSFDDRPSIRLNNQPGKCVAALKRPETASPSSG